MAKIRIFLGSKSDYEHIEPGIKILQELKLDYKIDIISAHRAPDKLRKAVLALPRQGAEVVIACAGMAAALPGFIASYSDIPVIGVAMPGGMLGGIDALLSITSIPRGIGVVASGMAKSGFINAIIFSLEILSIRDKKYRNKLIALKKKFK